MRHRKSGRKLGRKTDHRTALYRNLVTDLLRNGHLSTTEAKAKAIKGIAEKIITLGKREDLHARRQALSYVADKKVVAIVFDELAGRYSERPGGYTRLIKLGPRHGDAAPMVRLELVE